VRHHEDLSDAARRELLKKAGLDRVYLEQVGAIGTPGRDPHDHVVTVLFAALLAGDQPPLQSGGDTQNAMWFDMVRRCRTWHSTTPTFFSRPWKPYAESSGNRRCAFNCCPPNSR